MKIFRQKQKADSYVQANRMRRATQSQKTKLKTTGSLMSVDDEYTLNNSGPYKTPQSLVNRFGSVHMNVIRIFQSQKKCNVLL